MQPIGLFRRDGDCLDGALHLAPAFGDDLALFQINGLAQFLSPLSPPERLTRQAASISADLPHRE